MFINCNPKCKRGTTTASLDPEKNEVVCDYCGDVIAVSNFTKESMKRAGDTVQEKPKAYQYDCTTCSKTTPVTIEQDKIIGQNCTGNCKFNISSFTEDMLKSEIFKDTLKGKDE